MWVALVLVHGLRCSKARAAATAHCSRRKISLITCERFSRAWFHTARVSRAEAAQKRRVCRVGAARPLCFHSARQHERTERNGGFGFQTKVKEPLLKAEKVNMLVIHLEKNDASPVSDSQLSFTFCFRFEKLVIFGCFTSRYTMEAFLIFFYIIIILFLSVC